MTAASCEQQAVAALAMLDALCCGDGPVTTGTADVATVVSVRARARAATRWRPSSDGGLWNHSEITTESGHLLGSSRRSRSLSAMQSRKALRSRMGTPSVSLRRRRGSAVKHDSTLTDRLDANDRTLSTSHSGSTLSIQKTVFLTIFLAAVKTCPVAAHFPINQCLVRTLTTSNLFSCIIWTLRCWLLLWRRTLSQSFIRTLWMMHSKLSSITLFIISVCEYSKTIGVWNRRWTSHNTPLSTWPQQQPHQLIVLWTARCSDRLTYFWLNIQRRTIGIPWCWIPWATITGLRTCWALRLRLCTTTVYVWLRWDYTGLCCFMFALCLLYVCFIV